MSRTKADWRVRASVVPASQVAIRTRLRAAAIRRPTSFGVRYSRGRRPAYGTCRGRTVPFSAVGMRAWAVQFSRERTPVRVPAVPFWVQNGKIGVSCPRVDERRSAYPAFSGHSGSSNLHDYTRVD